MTADGKYQLSFRRKYPEAVPVEVKDLHTMWLHTPSMIDLGKFARYRQLQQKVADDLSKQDATRLEIIDIRVPNASSPYTGVILVDYDNIEYFTEQKVINTKAGELLYKVHVGELPPEVQQLILGRREPEPYSIAMSKVPLTLTVNAVTSALHKLALLSNAKFRSIRLIHVNRPQGYKVYQLIVGTEGEFISVLGYNCHKQARIGNTFTLLSTSKSSIVGESNPRDTNLVANVQKALAEGVSYKMIMEVNMVKFTKGHNCSTIHAFPSVATARTAQQGYVLMSITYYECYQGHHRHAACPIIITHRKMMTLPDCAATVQCPACKFPLSATRPELQQTYRARSCQDFTCSITIGSKTPACVSWDAAHTAECTPHISQSECLVIAGKEHSSQGILLSLEGTGAYHELLICCPQIPTIHSPFISSLATHVRYINQIPTIPLTELWRHIPLPPSCHPSEVPDHTDLYHQPPTLQQGRSSSHMYIAALSELSMCAYTVPCSRAVTSKTSPQEQAPQHQEGRGMRMDRPCQRDAMQLPKASPLRQQQLQSMPAPAALPLQRSQGCIIGSLIGQGRCQQLTRMCYYDLLAVTIMGRTHRLSEKADGGFQGEQGYMATLCICYQRLCWYYGDMLRWREPEMGPSSQSRESQGRAALVRAPGTLPIANSEGIAPNALSTRQSEKQLLYIENAATYSITCMTIPRTQRPPPSLVSTRTTPRPSPDKEDKPRSPKEPQLTLAAWLSEKYFPIMPPLGSGCMT